MKSTLLKRVIAIVGLVLCLALINWKIVEKQAHLADGKIVLLELAPVDPRSLMQGDFMALRYAIGNKIGSAVRADTTANQQKRTSIDGLAWVKLDENKVAQLDSVALNLDQASPDPNLVALHFRMRQSKIQLGTNAYFFQEGTGSAYETAKFGQFRVNKNGELLLTDLVDSQYQVITPTNNGKEAAQN